MHGFTKMYWLVKTTIYFRCSETNKLRNGIYKQKTAIPYLQKGVYNEKESLDTLPNSFDLNYSTSHDDKKATYCEEKVSSGKHYLQNKVCIYIG